MTRQEQHKSFPVKILREIKYTEWNSLNQNIHNMKTRTALTRNQIFSVSLLYYNKNNAAFEVLGSAQHHSDLSHSILSFIQ